MIVSTTINLFYNVLLSEKKIFFTSISLFFVPYFRFWDNGGFEEILFLFLFTIITVILFIVSSKELLDPSNRKAPYTILNIFWIMMSTFITLIVEINNKLFLPSLDIIYFYMFVIVFIFLIVFAKWSDQNKVIREKPLNSKEEFLPENFQFQTKSYQQIARTAKGTPVIAFSCFLFSLFLWYLDKDITIFRNFLYGIVLVLIVIISIGTFVDCKRFEKRTGEKPPTSHFLRRLIIMQVISIMLFVGSYFLLC